jgi:hypothetical protein
MKLWHVGVIQLLRQSSLFSSVQLTGGKVRAWISETLFLDVHFDPLSHSYSYALIDLTLPYPGDKRVFGWDDYPHPGELELAALPGAPHHYQERRTDGAWRFVDSSFRGNLENELPIVLAVIADYLL